MPTAPATITTPVTDRATPVLVRVTELVGELAWVVNGAPSPLGCTMIWTAAAGRWEAVYPAVWDGDQA